MIITIDWIHWCATHTQNNNISEAWAYIQTYFPQVSSPPTAGKDYPHENLAEIIGQKCEDQSGGKFSHPGIPVRDGDAREGGLIAICLWRSFWPQLFLQRTTTSKNPCRATKSVHAYDYLDPFVTSRTSQSLLIFSTNSSTISKDEAWWGSVNFTCPSSAGTIRG